MNYYILNAWKILIQINFNYNVILQIYLRRGFFKSSQIWYHILCKIFPLHNLPTCLITTEKVVMLLTKTEVINDKKKRATQASKLPFFKTMISNGREYLGQILSCHDCRHSPDCVYACHTVPGMRSLLYLQELIGWVRCENSLSVKQLVSCFSLISCLPSFHQS